MSKKTLSIICALVAMFTISVPTIASANYGYSMPIYAMGTRNDLLYIKRPESLSASTSDKTYTISAVGTPGTHVMVYKYNPYSGACDLIKDDTEIGASGLYSVVVDLSDNSNTFMVYGENYAGTQVTRIDINKIKKSTVDKLKGITVTIRDFFS